MSNRDEETDAFGRIVKRRFDGSDKQPSQHDSGHKQPRRDNYPRDQWSDNRGNRNYDNRFHEDTGDRRSSFPPQSQQSQPHHTSSGNSRNFLGFKDFAYYHQNQHRDASPDQVQYAYDQYVKQYMSDVSRNFFEASLGEEWFNDRYNPIRIRAQEAEAAAWAAKESERLRDDLLASPQTEIGLMNLDPLPTPPAAAKTESAKEEGGDAEKGEEGKAAEDKPEDLFNSQEPAALHLDGHCNRTVMLTGIHACCPKELLRQTVSDLLASKGLEPAARILIGLPQWGKLRYRERFERRAYVVLSTVEDALQAVRVFQDVKVDVPGPVDPVSGDRATLRSFQLSCTRLLPKASFRTFEVNSIFARMQVDTDRAVRMAALLDELRDVPADSRLATVLELSTVSAALVRPTDRLDLAITYLRRVHLVNFYGARLCRDEAQLLDTASSVMRRSKPCEVAADSALKPPPPPGKDRSGSSVSESGEAEESVGRKRKLDESSETPAESSTEPTGDTIDPAGEVGEEGDEAAAAAAAAAGDEVGAVPASPAGGAFKAPTVPLVNKAIEAILLDLRKRVEHKRRVAEGIADPAGDEADAARLEKQQESTYAAAVVESIAKEKDSKARCCFEFCKKLFKDVDFLSRHLRSKHEDFASQRLQDDARPYLLARFEKDDVTRRPLPPVEVEGLKEVRTVKEVVDKQRLESRAANARNRSSFGGGRNDYNGGGRQGGNFRDNRRDSRDSYSEGSRSEYSDNRGDSRGDSRGYGREQQDHGEYRDRESHHGRGQFDNRGEGDFSRDRRSVGGGEEGGRAVDHGQRGNDDRDRRMSSGGQGPSRTNEAQQQAAEQRRMASFVDVDAPKESAGTVDYGVALLPPVKRRKSAGKPAAAPAAETSAAEGN